MPKVSILVPVYNVEKYLPQCLESIAQQSLQDIEIICINDGSTDGSADILKSFAQEDSRFRIIQKENAGYGAALNDGLRAATGEYIGIVESDDKVDASMYEELYTAARKRQVDFVKSEAYYWYENINYIKRVHDKSLEPYFDKVLVETDRNIFIYFFMNIWTGIYSRDFLLRNEIFFNESPGASYQDNAFWMQTCLYAKRAMWLNRAFYYYRQDNPEASVRSASKMLAMTKEYEYLESVLKQRGHQELLPYCYSMRMFRLRGTFFRIADENKLDFLEQVQKDYAKYKAYIAWNRGIDDFIRTFINTPKQLCDRIHMKKDMVRNRVKEADAVIIYGIGKRADRVLRTLYNEGLYDKISCYAQTRVGECKEFAARDVLQIEEALTRYHGALVLVAAVKGTAGYMGMLDKLEELGVCNYMDTTEIEENFYIL